MITAAQIQESSKSKESAPEDLNDEEEETVTLVKAPPKGGRARPSTSYKRSTIEEMRTSDPASAAVHAR